MERILLIARKCTHRAAQPERRPVAAGAQANDPVPKLKDAAGQCSRHGAARLYRRQ